MTVYKYFFLILAFIQKILRIFSVNLNIKNSARDEIFSFVFV